MIPLSNRLIVLFFALLLTTTALVPTLTAEDGPNGYSIVKNQPTAPHDAFLNVEYLPEWRYSGDKSERRDAEMILDLWVPKGRNDCPLVMYVHGGSYSGGTKYLGKHLSEFANRLLEQGIAFGALNYVLLPKGIRPQVWHDYRDAARFLRKNATEYRLDPTKFGSFGISAGGWLVTTAGHGTGDHFAGPNNEQGVTLHKLIEQNFSPYMRKEGPEASVWGSMQNENPAYPGVYGRWQAVAFDFKALDGFATSGSPAMLDIVGAGYRGKKPRNNKHQTDTPPSLHELREAGIIDYTYADMQAGKFKGKNVHIPPLTGRKNDREHSYATHPLVEGEVELADVMVAWFADRLDSTNARAPVPEIWPAMRVIDGPTEVSMVVPADSITIHYTLDGSEPSTKSPVYTEPFSIPGSTVVKARAIMPERKPSGVAIATFVEGPVPPRLQQTERELPPAQTGQPYSFTFEADIADARYWLKGDLKPYVPWKKKDYVYPNGMQLDSASGVWSGTPTQPGKYWIQIAVQRHHGAIVRLHDFLWTVSGEPTGPSNVPAASISDENVEILHLPKLSENERSQIEDLCSEAELDLVIQQDEAAILLVPEKQAKKAKEILRKHFGDTLPKGAEWVD